jgi:hypothetical protein
MHARARRDVPTVAPLRVCTPSTLTIVAASPTLGEPFGRRKVSKLKAVLLLCGWLAVGCGDGSAEEQPDAAPDTTAPPLDPALQARVDAAIASMRSDPCLAAGTTSQCEWADYEIGPAQLSMAKSTGEAILIVDDLANFVPQLVRYRNRIAGYYKVSADHLELEIVSVRLPKRLGDVLASFAGPEFIPTSSLTDVGRAAWPAYAKLVSPSSAEHGGLVVGHLLDLVPEQPLVFVNFRGLLDIPPEICDRGINGETLAAATARKAALAASLRQVMTDHNVRFINASFGSTAPEVAESWQRTCATAVPSAAQVRELLHIYDPIYAALFSSEGVLAAHAAAELGGPEDFPFDQVNDLYPNQVRVGYISSSSSGLDEVGRGAVRKVKQSPSDGDADVYISWGCEENVPEPHCAAAHHEFVVGDGLKSLTLPFMASSFISPLGLARLINLRYANHAGEPMSNALIQTLKRELTPPLCGPDGAQPCVYQDPIAHHQLEPFRLQYISASDTGAAPVDIFVGPQRARTSWTR